MQAAAPGHVANVRHYVVDALSNEQTDQLAGIADAIVARLDPTGSMATTYTRYDDPAEPRPRASTAARTTEWLPVPGSAVNSRDRLTP